MQSSLYNSKHQPVRVHPLQRASQFLPRKAPWQKCLRKFGETSQWLTTDWVQESVCLMYIVASQGVFGKETHEPCTVSRHTVCTHKSNRALQRALGTLRATCKPHCLHQENLLPQPKQPGAQTGTQKQPYTACAFYKRRANASPQQGAGTTPPLLFLTVARGPRACRRCRAAVGRACTLRKVASCSE